MKGFKDSNNKFHPIRSYKGLKKNEVVLQLPV